MSTPAQKAAEIRRALETCPDDLSWDKTEEIIESCLAEQPKFEPDPDSFVPIEDQIELNAQLAAAKKWIYDDNKTIGDLKSQLAAAKELIIRECGTNAWKHIERLAQ